MRTGTRRGARLGSPTISLLVELVDAFLEAEQWPCIGGAVLEQQKAARAAREVRRQAVYRADVMDGDRPGLAETGTRLRQVDIAPLRVHRAAEPAVRAVMIMDRPLVAARHDHHRAVFHIDIVEHDA